MAAAVLASKRSKDKDMKVGACLVSPDNEIIGFGYNGHPKVQEGLDNDECYPWTKNLKNYKENKHKYVVHAEINAIVHCSGQQKGSTMFVTLNPCNECAKLIVQHEIKEVVYLWTKNFRDNALDASKVILGYSNTKLTKFSDYMEENYPGHEYEKSVELSLEEITIE